MKLDHVFTPRDRLARFIHEFLKANEISAKTFLDDLGYSNRGKASDKLLLAYDSGQFDNDLLKRLVNYFDKQGLNIRPVIIAKTIDDEEQNKKLIEEQEVRDRAEFRPFVHIYHERSQPSPIFIFAMTGGTQRWQRLELPSTLSTGVVSQEKYQEKYTATVNEVCALVKRHFEAHGKDYNPLGNVTEYRFQCGYDEYVSISVEGLVLARGHGTMPRYRYGLTIKDRRIPESLFLKAEVP